MLLCTCVQVTNFNAIETAAVPIMTFDFDDINIDLGLACLPIDSVPADIDIDDDAILKGVDTPTEKCLNGPRVTNMIHR
jgi:poly(A) polymerase